MDLISEELRDQVYKQKEAELKQLSLPQKITCFKTSIWDETLYRAWSSIVYALIPNVRMVESRLEKFCRICEADEVVLFEKATFLVISHATRGESSSSSSSTSSTSAALPSITSAGSSTSELSNGQNATSPTATGATMGTSSGASSTSAAAITMPQAGNAATSSASSSSAGSVPPHERDPHRFEKISNIIKQFKLSCSKSQAQFSSMEVRNAHFSAYITEFTANTYVMVIVSDPSIQSTATLVNIRIARKHFDPWMKNE
jgi:Ras-related GTP-binding protein A/B